MKRFIAALILTLACVAAYGKDLTQAVTEKNTVTLGSTSKYYVFVNYSAAGTGWEIRRMTLDSIFKVGGIETTAPDGERYVNPGNTVACSPTAPALSICTLPTGAYWNPTVGTWEKLGVTYDDAPLWANFASYMLRSDHDAYVAAAQVKFDNFSTQISQLKSAVVAGGGTLVGAAPSTLTPLAFGNVTTNQTRTLTAQIDNGGLGDLVIGTVPPPTGTGASKFTTNGGCSGQTIVPGASCLESITFAPGTGTGEFTAQISFPHNGAGSPTLLDLTGTGVAPIVAVCSATPSLDIATTANTASPMGSSTSNNYNGILVETGQASRTVCKVAFYVHTISGGVGGLNYQAEVWGTDGNKAFTGIVKAISAPVSGGNISEGGYVVFTFNAPVTVLATDAIVLTRTDHGSNSTNYVSVGVSTVADTSSPSGVYSHAARWGSTGAIASESTTQDKRVLIYEVQ